MGKLQNILYTGLVAAILTGSALGQSKTKIVDEKDKNLIENSINQYMNEDHFLKSAVNGCDIFVKNDEMSISYVVDNNANQVFDKGDRTLTFDKETGDQTHIVDFGDSLIIGDDPWFESIRMSLPEYKQLDRNLGEHEAVEIVEEEPTGLGVTANLAIKNHYHFEGLQFSDGPVLQHLFSKKFGPLEVTGMFNINLENINIDEYDIFMLLSQEITEGIIGSVGFNYYTFPGSTSIPELYAGVTTDLPGNVAIEGWYFPVDQNNGFCIVASANQDVNIAGQPINIEGRLGYHNNYMSTITGFGNASVYVSTPIETGGLTLTPKIGFTKGLDEEIEDTPVFGLNAGFEF